MPPTPNEALDTVGPLIHYDVMGGKSAWIWSAKNYKHIIMFLYKEISKHMLSSCA